MIRISAWHTWQGNVIHAALRTRRTRLKAAGADLALVGQPLSIASVSVAAKFDADFQTFAARLGRPDADALFLRVLQYAAQGHGLAGTVPVPRSHFGAIVLARAWHVVSRKLGEAVYDALIESGLATPLGSEPHSGNVSSYETGCETCSASRNEARSRRPSRAVPCRSEEPPPPPSKGGEEVAPPDDPEPPAEPAPDLRPRDRERLARILEYVIHCGAFGERGQALSLRQRFRVGDIRDHEIAQLLELYRWVTPDRLARFEKDRPNGAQPPGAAEG